MAALARRELVRTGRQRLRLGVAVLTPGLIWLFVASGFAGSVRPDAVEGGSFTLYLLPGMASLVVLFNAIFASISLIEDRHAGLLQAVLVSPCPRWALAGGKLVGGGAWGVAQAAVLLAGAPLVGGQVEVAPLLAGAVAVCCLSLGVTGLGLAAAWRVDSTAGFHGVMNLVLMPMWLLSGAIFPVQGASGWLRVLAAVNPLAWCQQAVRSALLGRVDTLALGLALAFAAGGVGLALLVMGRRRSA